MWLVKQSAGRATRSSRSSSPTPSATGRAAASTSSVESQTRRRSSKRQAGGVAHAWGDPRGSPGPTWAPRYLARVRLCLRGRRGTRPRSPVPTWARHFSARPRARAAASFTSAPGPRAPRRQLASGSVLDTTALLGSPDPITERMSRARAHPSADHRPRERVAIAIRSPEHAVRRRRLHREISTDPDSR